MRVRVYVDGFNLYYGGKRLAARHNGGKVPTWKWLDLRALASRITEQRWFRHEHDFPDRVWQRPEIRSRANCEACHRNAAQGSYEDD